MVGGGSGEQGDEMASDALLKGHRIQHRIIHCGARAGALQCSHLAGLENMAPPIARGGVCTDQCGPLTVSVVRT